MSCHQTDDRPTNAPETTSIPSYSFRATAPREKHQEQLVEPYHSVTTKRFTGIDEQEYENVRGKNCALNSLS